ncbi:MAG: Response regulator with CheY-like receiver domain and winged-helix DNA-binding domain [Phenylobacterium sp.]|jgi:two-component system OmpR family response regulator|uniref:response regulator transcription factor n=1 Tax=Phenylobacterium sp. TaxID=1871053 RepID=UPI002631E849|nr:response regulator transcription factor [Phenylobacterium sp.]MDB5428220.1 Response regulator with CheY-like receiver domain and winged-helix DNA-binding domain [Phenylobacterium sp.]MDB5435384.1 Response regulator with CheY-like receiver domain and winged-helix DNA-binding domain [Phenylobacterium sp.]MDB5463932.1 Response regulator with CheY-like receiver domain and winged-helix DNA-binding domain [Phenylobacterium sp.]MDB5496341.1 Response regulator with CheY-like receiver domain and wing
MPKILAIEDDATTGKEIVAELEQHGFVVEWTPDGRDGLTLALSGDFDAVILDRLLPRMDGLAIVTEMRGANVDIPVLMISALSDVDERIRGLRAGGDDYMTKPFASEELAARLEVLLRRRQAAPRQLNLSVADLDLDLISRTAHRGGAEIRLMPTEYKLLEFMMRNSGQILTRTMIFEAIWGYHFDPGTNLIDVHLGRLRRKIDRPGLAPLIHTVRGSGYALNAPG